MAVHSQSHSAELQWQHLQSQYREPDLLQGAQEAGHHSPLRRLLAKKTAAAAADDEDDEVADDSYEDEMDLDEPMAAGRPFLLSPIEVCCICKAGRYLHCRRRLRSSDSRRLPCQTDSLGDTTCRGTIPHRCDQSSCKGEPVLI